MSTPIHPNSTGFDAVDKPGSEGGTPGVAAEINEVLGSADAQDVDKPGTEGGTPGFVSPTD